MVIARNLVPHNCLSIMGEGGTKKPNTFTNPARKGVKLGYFIQFKKAQEDMTSTDFPTHREKKVPLKTA